jgi:ABC-type uncharacterized transport system substrate-binding protein
MSRFCSIALVLFLVAPVVTEAQHAGRGARVGELIADPVLRESFHQGLRELGYVEGQNITFETRSVEGPLGRLSDLAAELVRLHVDLILVDTSPALQAVRQATNSIPIVMAGFGDPVAEGFVTALARPGGNITGFSWQTPESAGKRLELLKEVRPTLFTEAGGLPTYGPKMSDLYRRVAVYADKILKGAKAGELPIERPTQFELVINLKTAKVLGLTIPQSLLLRANEVIQ